MLKKLIQNSRTILRRTNNTNSTLGQARFQKRSSATTTPSGDKSRITSTGWTYESPNLAQYTALRGAMVSICLRGLYVWNLVMLMAEITFYPFNIIDIVKGKKRF
ncbi:hypothetical protein FDP41_001327 [Naegleria fowleri]|uniref:Uncharacterized protein n=1 Tax=Naegleria fowleri TaxID=5763 RepID=A0A6A5C304_NAEFO|nr:uncharacterized protein FDP41_001327 [Naegleria fowleri]KAF0979659.1 hypothetical protein FDP41_001327 [Naegleria fowleri]CAG4711230.1 unnamed protein product [Naegleria fowleri]